MFAWLKWTKLCAIIEKDNRLILNLDKQIGSAISIDIAERTGDRKQVAAVAQKGGTGVDHRVGRIPTGEFDDSDMAIEVHKDKV